MIWRVTVLVALLAHPAGIAAQWVGTAAQTYLSAGHNRAFRHEYPFASNLFNAFDFGHAILSETLLRHPADAGARLDGAELAFIVGNLLRRPPAEPVDEHAIAPTFTRLVPEVAAVFDWAHMLHRQVYDIWADRHIPLAKKDAAVAEVLAYYQSRRDLALSARPKTMALMTASPQAGSFSAIAPRFRTLIWAYHWLQLAVYDELIADADVPAPRDGVADAVARFRAMLDGPANSLPRVMPLAGAVAPVFAQRYPPVAAIFDNLHALHDVVSDILATPAMSRDRKRAALLAAAAAYRDSARETVDLEAWATMSRAMGVEQMGGAARGH